MRAVPGAPDDLALALELADVADAITLARFRAEDLVVETKPDLTPVTEADRAVEQALREHLAAAPRRHGVRRGVRRPTRRTEPAALGRRWIVDPIDGTKSYVRGMPVWATLLALEEDGEMVVGVVSAPAHGPALVGGARRRRVRRRRRRRRPRRLRVSGIRRARGRPAVLRRASRSGARPGGSTVLLALSERCWRTRGYGDFWQYMLVAEGAAEIALDPAVSLWDLAAPMVIVQEAGGRFTDLAGSATAAGGDGIATNGLVHEAARRSSRR